MNQSVERPAGLDGLWHLPGTRSRLHDEAMPPGEWAYLVDDFDILYGPGSWPFHRLGRGPVTVRFSPDAENRSWGGEYVSLGPSFWDDGFAEAVLQLDLGYKPGTYSRHRLDGKIRLDLRAGQATVHDSVPEPVRGQAQMKADRLLAAVVRNCDARAAGFDRPLTAWAHFHPEKAVEYGHVPTVTIAESAS